ncbi:glycosyltransferase family 2 protein [Alteromonas halophila]|uniref:Glycosyltransferase 2-like domain-containing protein n=1 Tax=Alteromonas halophila TaxID=516698 RepID=A0A918MZT2_9ALTE|nr:glycosyltransferase family A protein [Alteromonas halophila]GGW86936.1 hypothetical protein GCM10007391_20900 [Alteromonas halophila]
MQEQEKEFKISVVIPFYKAYDFFAETLETVKAQTLPVSEIIVVNDGCGKQAEEFLAQFDGITVHSLSPNQGVSVARNKGVEIATSEWIAFLDADDHWQADKLAEQVSFLKAHPEFDGVHTGVETFNKTGSVNTFLNKPESLSVNNLLISSHVSPSSFMLKRSVFEKLDGFDTQMHCSEDHDFTIRMIESGHLIGFIPKALIRLRRDDHGNLSSNGRKVIKGHLQLVRKHASLFKKYNASKAYFLYRTFMSAGGKTAGAEGKVYYLIGRFFNLFATSG